MALVSSKEMLIKARNGGYAVGAFNADNMEVVKAIIRAAEEMKAPVIVQTTPKTISYGSSELYVAMVQAEAKKATIPVCLHLDHGMNQGLIEECIAKGYTSVMIDGSKESFEKNIQLTQRVVEVAKEKNIPVEAELGQIGGSKDTYTKVEEAIIFVENTNIDSLAIAIGTAHGFYAGEPKLNKDRLSQIAQVITIPLVLHGASGLLEEEVKDCVARGIAKVNFATEVRVAYTEAIKILFKKEPDIFDTKIYGEVGMKAVRELVRNKIKICGCENKE